MNTTKAIYWIALGALALGLSSEYDRGSFQPLHRIADRAGSIACRFVTHAEQSLAMAQVPTRGERREFRLNDQFMARQQAQAERVMAEHQAGLDRAMALRQADLDRVQEQLDRMQAALERSQMARERGLERARLQFSDAANRRMIVVCPKTGARIAVSTSADLSGLSTELSDVGSILRIDPDVNSR